VDGVGRRSQDSLNKRLVLLALVVSVGAVLRFEGLGEPSYWLDEVLGHRLTSQAMAQPWWQWVMGSEPEHGPLYYATQAATRLAGSDEFAGRLAAALFGLATIPLVWVAAVTVERGRDELRGTSCAIAAAALLAISPFHVYYSREARPYALVMLLTAALLVLLLRAASLWSIALVSAALLYTSAVAAPIVAAGAVAALFGRRRLAVVPQLFAGAAFLLLYRQPPGETPGVPFGGVDTGLFATILRSFTVSASGMDTDGRTVIALSAFAAIGAVALFLHDRRVGAIVLSMTVLPVVLTIAALATTGHWFALRYTGAGIVGFCVLAAAGIVATATLVARRRGIAFAVTLAVVLVTARQTWETARREPYQKLNWRGIAQKLAHYSRPGDLILAAETSTGIVSDFYLSRAGVRAVDVQTSLVPIAEQLRSEHPATFILSTNAPGDAPMRAWTCGHPLLLASPLDQFRLHYAGLFLEERSQAPEHRAVATTLGEDVLYRTGWASVEGNGADAFRWVIGETATMIASGAVRLRMLPLDHSSLPPQRVRISVNGRDTGELPLQRGWNDHTLQTPQGMNTVTFTFARATAPAALDPRNADTRKLSAAFQLPEEARLQTRIASGPLLDENAAWRGTRSRFTRLRRETTIPLLGRLGFDPDYAWPRLERGELRLEDLVESVAYGSECVDDQTFVRNTFELLFERTPDVRQRLELPRIRFINRLVKSDEFRDRYSYRSSTSST
jgi:mannosyltransferase